MYFGADTDDAFEFVSAMLGWMIADVGDHARAPPRSTPSGQPSPSTRHPTA